LIALFVTVCLFAAPDTCQGIRFAPENPQEATLISCMMASEPTAAEWLNEHPAWSFKRSDCKPDRPKKELPT
jgi:hypothetical protein